MNLIQAPPRAKQFRRQAELIAKRASECFVRPVARIERDSEDIRRSIRQRACGFRQTPPPHIASERASDRQPEQARQMIARDPRDRRGIVQRDLFVEMAFDEPDRFANRIIQTHAARIAIRLVAGLIVFAVLMWAASPAGIWKGELTINQTKSQATLALAVSGSKLTGTLTANGGTDEILNGSIRRGVVSFVIATGMDNINSLIFRGSVKGNSLTFQIRQGPDEEGRVISVGNARLRRAQ